MTEVVHGSQTDPEGPQTPAQSRQRAGMWFAVALVGGFVLFLLVALAVGGANAGHDENHDRESIAQCEARIEKLLKSPGTAEFNSTTSATGSEGWRVTGTVDAENSFGSTVRASYGCTVVMNGDGTATTTVDYFDQ